MNSEKVLQWIKGLISAIISGAANAVTVMIVEPSSFNLQEGWGKLLTVAIVSAIWGAAMYLKKSPIPNGSSIIPKSNRHDILSMLPIFIIASSLLIATLGCGMVKPSSNIDKKLGPVCDRIDYKDSLICEYARRAGFKNAEDVRDLLLDANDISIILEYYTVDQLAAALSKWEKYAMDPVMTYQVLFKNVKIDIKKASRVKSILDRRLGILLDLNGIIRLSDRKLLITFIKRVREANGIPITS